MNKSDVRIRLTTTDYVRLVDAYNQERKEQGFIDLFGKTPTDIDEILTNSKNKLGFIKIENYTQYFFDHNTYGLKENTIYFGWDYLEWQDYNGFVLFIKNFLETECKRYAIARISEDMPSSYAHSVNMKEIGIELKFDGDED